MMARMSWIVRHAAVAGMLFAAVLLSASLARAAPAAAEALPNFAGMPLAKAMEAARGKKLAPEVYPTPRPTADKKLDGVVASQYPAAGMPVPNSRKVVLTPYKYSAAVSENVVPNVVGATLDKAKATLTQLGFQVHVFEIEHTLDKAKADIVFKQNPPPGTKLARGQYVHLGQFEYHASATATVPNVVGMSVAGAKSALKKSGFTIVNTSGVGQPGDRVTGQRPAAGQVYGTFNEVVLYTTVKQSRRVPQVIDMKIADAAKKVVQAGLHPVMEPRAGDPRPGPPRLGGGAPPVRSGIVLQQRPAPGEMLGDGEAVYLVYVPAAP